MSQLSALNSAAAAAMRFPGGGNLSSSQLQQLASLQQHSPQQLQQLIRAGAGMMGGQAQPAAAHRPRQQPSSHTNGGGAKQFPTKLTQIKEFPVERSNQPAYKLQKALIDQKIVPCINVRPYVFHDLMMTLPDFVRHFYPELSIEKARHMLQDILKVVLYKGNTGHQEVLRAEGKCGVYDPVPLVLVKDIMTYMPQIKYMFTNMMTSEPSSKRPRVA